MWKFLLNKTRGLKVKFSLGEGAHLINKENGQKRKNIHTKQNKNKINLNWYLITKNNDVYFFLKKGGGKTYPSPTAKNPKPSIAIIVMFLF